MAQRVPQCQRWIALIGQDSKMPGQLIFKMPHGFQGGWGSIQVIEPTAQKIVKLWCGMLRLHGGFEELAKISGKQSDAIRAAQALSPSMDGNLAQTVKLTLASLTDADFTAVEEIQLTGERTLGPARALCHRFEQAMLLREPVDDQAGIRQARQPGDDRLRFLHGGKLQNPQPLTMEIVPSSFAIRERDDALILFLVDHFGITNDCPGRMRVPLTPLARCKAETEVPLRLAIAESESPDFTT